MYIRSTVYSTVAIRSSIPIYKSVGVKAFWQLNIFNLGYKSSLLYHDGFLPSEVNAHLAPAEKIGHTMPHPFHHKQGVQPTVMFTVYVMYQ